MPSENLVLHDFPNYPVRERFPRNPAEAVGTVRSALRHLYQQFTLCSMTRPEALANVDARLILQNAYGEILKASDEWKPSFEGETINSLMRTVARRQR